MIARRSLAALGALLLGAVLASPALVEPAACGPFRVDWGRADLPRAQKLEGYVYNDSACSLSNIRLHAIAVDGEGRTTGESTGWVFGNLPPRARAYFALPVPSGPAADYRIDVLSFDQVTAPSQEAP
ncbi:MAG TPA: hypothetical protein VFW70_12140 [Methylomirabilota bacterium]|nr:hypothetical protein [Methylomirabilota bacterium]